MKKQCAICRQSANKYVVIRNANDNYKFGAVWRCDDHIKKAKLSFGDDNVEVRDSEDATRNDNS